MVLGCDPAAIVGGVGSLRWHFPLAIYSSIRPLVTSNPEIRRRLFLAMPRQQAGDGV